MAKYLDKNEPVKQTCPIINEAQDCITELYRIITSSNEYIPKADISGIDYNLDRLKIILEELRSANSSLRNWGNDWCDKASDFQRENDELKDDIDDYESRINLLEDENDELRDNIKDYKYIINSLEDDIYHLKNNE